MWRCIRCKTEFPELSDDVQPRLDDFGLYYMCPICGRRNRLRCIDADEDGVLVIEQIDEPK
jgi:hypothetical protein